MVSVGQPTYQVFFSEADPSRPSIFDIGVDTHERETVRCSGTIVCTGTGSTAWFESAAKVRLALTVKP